MHNINTANTYLYMKYEILKYAVCVCIYVQAYKI